MMMGLAMDVREIKQWFARRKQKIMGMATVQTKSRDEAHRGEYERLKQESDEEWSYEAAKIYVQAWVVSWHQMHNADAKDVALWSHEDLEVIAAEQQL
jgi:hypothetical protein